MTGARKIEANRRNARASTGPRTGAGKARAAQNARRHGLNLPARYDPTRAAEIVALARAIAGADAGANAASSHPGSPPPRSMSSGPGARAWTSIRRRCASAMPSRGLRRSTATRGARCRCANARCATSTMRPIELLLACWPAFRRREATAQGAQQPGNGGLGAAGVSFKLSASSIYPWDGPEAALIRSMIAESLRPTRSLSGHFDKTKPTARMPRVTESSPRSRVGKDADPELASHHTNGAAPCPRVTREVERPTRGQGAQGRATNENRSQAPCPPYGSHAGVTLPAHFDKTKPTARMPRVTESSPRSRVGKGADPELASHHPNGAAPCPRVTREVERPTRGQGAQGRATNQNRSQAPCPPYGSHAGVTLPAYFDKTKPTARMPRVTESSPRSRVGKGADPELASHHTNGAAPCPRVTREVERPTRGQGAQGRTANQNRSHAPCPPYGSHAGVTLPAHFDKTKPTARMPRVTESSPRSRVGKGADPVLASHHTNGAALCPRVTREVERPTRGKGAQGRATNQNRSQAPCPPYGGHAGVTLPAHFDKTKPTAKRHTGRFRFNQPRGW